MNKSNIIVEHFSFKGNLDYDFKDTIFNKGFSIWEEIKGDITINDSIIKGETTGGRGPINGKLIFKNCLFETLNCYSVLWVTNDCIFEYCVFEKNFDFECHIEGNAIFKNNIFKDGLNFGDSIFEKDLIFENNTIYGETDILYAKEPPRGGVPEVRGNFIYEAIKLLNNKKFNHYRISIQKDGLEVIQVSNFWIP